MILTDAAVAKIRARARRYTRSRASEAIATQRAREIAAAQRAAEIEAAVKDAKTVAQPDGFAV